MGRGAVWVHAELAGGVVAPVARELLTRACGLGGEVHAVVAGPLDEAAAAALGEWGATTVRATGDLDGRAVGVVLGAALADALTAEPDAEDALVLLGSGYDARDVAARLSVRLGRGVLAHATDVVVDDAGTVSVRSEALGGRVEVTSAFTGPGPHIVLVAPRSIEAVPSGGPPAEVRPLPVPELGRAGGARVVARHVDERSGPSLDDARVVVAGGRGLGDAERFALVEELAGLLGGAPAASRAVVDAGWRPYAYQVGQTGRVVAPEVYLAFGISGATQHMVGLKGARTLIAVNKDRGAPIFEVADLGIVGDAGQVLPRLIDELRRRG